jgi:hypothetical protein
MIFHITSQHNWETCEGSKAAKGENVPPRSERQTWLEGNDKVKVIGAYGYQTQHRYYAIVEADDYADVHALFSGAGHIRNGEVEVLPVNDLIANRKSYGEWGK